MSLSKVGPSDGSSLYIYISYNIKNEIIHSKYLLRRWKLEVA